MDKFDRIHSVELQPDFVEAHVNLGNAWKDQGQLTEAIACCQRALQLRPDLAEAHSNLGNAWRDQGQLTEAIACYRRAVDLKPEFAAAHSNLVYTLSMCPEYDAKTIYEEHRRWNQQHAEPLAKFIQPIDADYLERRAGFDHIRVSVFAQTEDLAVVGPR